MANGSEAARAPSTAVALPTALLITDARSYAATLREAVAAGDVSVDAGGLKDIDTAGLQLLCATRAAVLAGGHGFGWAAESPGLRGAATATGLVEALGLAA